MVGTPSGVAPMKPVTTGHDALAQQRAQALLGALGGAGHQGLGAAVMRIGDDDFRGGNGLAWQAELGRWRRRRAERRGARRCRRWRRGSRREFAEQGGAVQQALEFVEDFGEGGDNFGPFAGIATRAMAAAVLLAQRVDQARSFAASPASAWRAASISRLVTPLMAETTTTTGRDPAAALTISAARRMQLASPTDVPPNFITHKEDFHPLWPSRILLLLQIKFFSAGLAIGRRRY